MSCADPPQPVLSVNQSTIFLVDNNVSIECVVEYIPGLIGDALTITWTRQEEAILSGYDVSDAIEGPLLLFNPITESDGGVYTCEVAISVPQINLYLNSRETISIGRSKCFT